MPRFSFCQVGKWQTVQYIRSPSETVCPWGFIILEWGEGTIVTWLEGQDTKREQSSWERDRDTATKGGGVWLVKSCHKEVPQQWKGKPQDTAPIQVDHKTPMDLNGGIDRLMLNNTKCLLKSHPLLVAICWCPFSYKDCVLNVHCWWGGRKNGTESEYVSTL